MPINPANAVAAYSNTARAGVPAPDIAHEPVGPSFTELVSKSAEDALATGQAAERQTVQALGGKAELTEVVSAVANAEVTLQTVVSIRDKVVAAYQEILRMPI